MSEFSRETLLNIIETDHVQCGEASALASMALAAMDSEPVAEVLSNRQGNDTSTIDRVLPIGTQLYRHAQPASEREQVRSAHAEWSQATFGNVGPVGPLKHLSKEALEAAEQPGDLSEWADMQFLLWDAQRRAGITDDQITQAMIDKLAVNKQREWPEPKDGEPRLHIKAQPAPVVPDAATAIRACLSEFPESARDIVEECADIAENACRAAMLHAGNSPAQSDCCPAQNVVAPAQSPIDHGYLPECECAGCKATARICAELSVNSPANPGCWCRTCRPVDLNDMRFVVCPDCGSKRCPRANDHRNACTGSNEPGQEGSAHPDTPQSPGSEPATVPGKWIPVSERMPEVGDIVLTAMGGSVNIGEMECSAANCRFFTSVISGRELPATHWMPLPASPQEVK